MSYFKMQHATYDLICKPEKNENYLQLKMPCQQLTKYFSVYDASSSLTSSNAHVLRYAQQATHTENE